MQRQSKWSARAGWLAGLGAAALLAACGSTPAPPGTPAPDFELAASDGNTHTLRSLTANGPVFFYAIKRTCPINKQAHPFFVKLAQAYAGKATFVGVIDRDAEGYKGWQEEYEAPYTVLFDPDRKIIDGLDMKRSPWLVQVNRDGTVARSWPGYSELDLNEMAEAMAAAAGISPVEVDFAGAPERTRYG